MTDGYTWDDLKAQLQRASKDVARMPRDRIVGKLNFPPTLSVPLVPKACYDELVALIHALPHCPWCCGGRDDHHQWCKFVSVLKRNGVPR